MNSLRSLLSGLSWAFFNVGCYATHYVVFRPTFWECLLFVAVEGLSFWITAQVDKKLFPYLYPATKAYFPDFSVDRFDQLNRAQKKAVFTSLTKFPMVRAGYTWIISYFKILPTNTLIVVFVWDHPNTSNLAQFGIFMAIESIWYAYLYGVQFVELHGTASTKIAQLHAKHDWSDIFSDTLPEQSRSNFKAQEMTAFVSIWASLTILQWLIITNNQSDPIQLAAIVSLLTLAALVLMARIWFLARRYFFDGLESLFEVLSVFEPHNFGSLPLHSSFELARFETIFNRMISRLRAYERELSQWIFTHAEQSRFHAMGELSSLIVHDLSGPLHVVKFCTDQLIEEPERIQDDRYIKQLQVNCNRASELVNSLRDYLRNSKQAASKGATLGKVIRNSIRVLDIQYQNKPQYSEIEIELDPKMDKSTCLISSSELSHVFVNLLSNSVQNLMDHSIANPQVRIQVADSSENSITVQIRDNGSGLAPERFEELTAFFFRPRKDGIGREGLGLRLVRRLLERAGGKMQVVAVPAGEAGTSIQLELPVSTPHKERDGMT